MDLRALQQIHIVEQDRVLPFEWDDDARTEIVADPSGILRDPLLVTPLDDEGYLLLDDVRLYYSLIDAGVQHLPVQICPPVQLSVQTGPVGLIHFGPDDLMRVASRFPDRIELLQGDAKHVDSPDILHLSFEFANAPAIHAHIRHSSRSGCPVPLDALFRTIVDSGSYFLIPEGGEEADLFEHVPYFTGSIILPHFDLEDLRCAVLSGRPFPPGLFQIQAACRVLGIDFPVQVLTDQSGVEDKQSFLAELIGLRARRRRIACYDGRVYRLNR